MTNYTSSALLKETLEKSFDSFYHKHIKDSQDWLKINEKLQLLSSNINEFLDNLELRHDKINKAVNENTYQNFVEHANNFCAMWKWLEPSISQKFGIPVENKKLFFIIKLQILNEGLKRKNLSELFMISFLHTPGHLRIFREAVESACMMADNMEPIVFDLTKEIFTNMNTATQYLFENPKEVKYLHSYGAAFPTTVSAVNQLMLGIILNKTDLVHQKKRAKTEFNGVDKTGDLVKIFIDNKFFTTDEINNIVKKSFVDPKFSANSYHLMLDAGIKNIQKAPDFKKKLFEWISVWATNRTEDKKNQVIYSHFFNCFKANNISLTLNECANITKSCYYFGTNDEAAKLIYTAIEPQSALLLSQILKSGFLPDRKETQPALLQSLVSIHEKHLISQAIDNQNTSVKKEAKAIGALKV